MPAHQEKKVVDVTQSALQPLLVDRVDRNPQKK